MRFSGLPALRVLPALLCAGAFAAIALLAPAVAATHDQIKKTCKEQMHPQVMACALAKGLKGNHEAVHEQCGYPLVYSCVVREEAKQAAGTPAPAAPKDAVTVDPAAAAAIQPTFVAPPRTISDITAILDSEKPDDTKIAAREAAADATPPGNASGDKLAQFYFDRGTARALLARNKDALADGLQALAIAKRGSDHHLLARVTHFVALQYKALGDPRNAIATSESMARLGNEPGHRLSLISALTDIVQTLISMGDVSQAATYAGRIKQRVEEARGSPSPRSHRNYIVYGHTLESDADTVRGMVFEARGQYPEAEAAYRRALAFRRAAINDLPRFDFPPPPEQFMQAADTSLLAIARNESKQGRLSEAEADARQALLEILKAQGKYSPATPQFIVGLADILVEQGRYQDAERLAHSALDVQRKLGIGDDAPQSAQILSQLGNVLIAERKAKDAAIVYAQLDKAIAQWPPEQRDAIEFNGSRIAALYASGQIEAGIAAAEQLVKRQAARTGENSYDTASAHGTLGVGDARAGRDADAIREFKAAVPILMAATSEFEDDDPTLVAARSVRLQRIVEAYISVLARSPNTSNDVAVETFGLADAVRGHAVQQALADSNGLCQFGRSEAADG